jgi:hypothetical protein
VGDAGCCSFSCGLAYGIGSEKAECWVGVLPLALRLSDSIERERSGPSKELKEITERKKRLSRLEESYQRGDKDRK